MQVECNNISTIYTVHIGQFESSLTGLHNESRSADRYGEAASEWRNRECITRGKEVSEPNASGDMKLLTLQSLRDLILYLNEQTTV